MLLLLLRLLLWLLLLQATDIMLENNTLTGPAFPPGWLLPGAMPGLKVFSVQDNPGLTGTLPANLNWTLLSDL